MKRIKGRYVALLEIDLDTESNPNHKPFNEIRDIVMGDEMTNSIKQILMEGFDISGCKVELTKQYADAIEVDDNPVKEFTRLASSVKHKSKVVRTITRADADSVNRSIESKIRQNRSERL